MEESNPSLVLAFAEQHLIAAQQHPTALYILAKAISGIGGRPMVLRPVNPVPIPSIARPGASRLMVAIE
jgi:hypothetical protein